MSQVRKHILFLLLLILSIQANASDLYFRLHDYSAFTIVFNYGVPTYGCRYFQMNNLAPGNYPIEVYNSCLTINSPCMIPLYRGELTVPAGCQIMAYLDLYNRLQAGNLIPLLTNANNVYSSNVGYNFRFNYGWSNLNDSIGYAEAQKILSETSNTKQKLNYLKHCIYFNGINAQRLSELMLSFSFDSERLDLASYSYAFTSDRQNYYKVFDALIFNGSKQQLDNHLYYLSATFRY